MKAQRVFIAFLTGILASCRGINVPTEGSVRDAAPGSGTDAIEPEGAGSVLFSEIMYHPVLENDDTEWHEFLELYNPGAKAVSLAKWSIGGAIQFTFPAQAIVPAKGFLVVAKSADRLRTDVPDYKLDPAQVVGDYQGQLDNGGGVLSLVRPDGSEAEHMSYGDHFPWPAAADALGASDDFFEKGDRRLPFTDHQYRGHSLERVSYDASADDVSNWAPSALDGMTPGRANGITGPAPATVLSLDALPAGSTDFIGPTDKVTVRATFSTPGPATPQLEMFIEYQGGKLEPPKPTKVPFKAADQGAMEASLPPQVESTIVRYRVVDGNTVLSPRPTDPNAWFGYFVYPAALLHKKAIHIFIAPERWGEMYTNINDIYTWKTGRVPAPPPEPPDGGWPDTLPPTVDGSLDLPGPNKWKGCTPNPDWDKRVPAVFVDDGKVYDVRVRYQGSPYNRWWGPEFITPFEGQPPVGGPDPMMALSWSVLFPRYARYNGRGHVHLNKLTQACPGGLTTQVVPSLFNEAGIPALKVFDFYRVYVNGGYYHYMMDREHEDDDMMRRILGKGVPIGDMWKNVGYDEEQGPYGIGDGRLLTALCGFTVKERYDATFDRVNYPWRNGADEIKALLEELNAARAADLKSADPMRPAQRQLLTTRFDLDALLTYKAIMNWANVWDDYFQNHFFYKRPDNGKFMILPYDFDYLMEYVPPEMQQTDVKMVSYYVGEENDPSGRLRKWRAPNKIYILWNLIFDSLFKTFRKEYNQKLKELDATILSPTHVAQRIDEIVKASAYNQAEARRAPAGTPCETDYTMAAQNMKLFATARHKEIMSGVGFREP